MTSEVAVMNKQGIALAADSAVTFREGSGQKIFTSATKIFALSKYQPVAVMFYGNASLMGIPWETIVKVYRNRLNESAFGTVREYADNLLTFLGEEDQLLSEEEQQWYVESSIYGYFELVKSSIRQNVEETLEREGKIDEATISRSVAQILEAHYKVWSEQEILSTVPEDFPESFRDTYGHLIEQALEVTFEKLPMTDNSKEKLNEIAVSLFTKSPPNVQVGGTSGIVVAGFGTEELFPILESFSIEGRVGSYLKHRRIEERCAEITFTKEASIRSFAQDEMVTTFMAGVDPSYQNLIDGYVGRIYDSYPGVLVDNISGMDEESRSQLNDRLREIGQKEFEKYLSELLEFRKRTYSDPIMSVVSALPKDELAAMAESLISLTSFKRRVSMGDETVAGPIDVAVISKGDGFIWKKRKHYFERELNPQFFSNYNRREPRNDA